MPSEQQSHDQDSESVKQFFDQWHIYSKVVEFNYLRHRESFRAVEEVVRRCEKPFSFLDLGAGDARWTSLVLKDSPVSRYQAVDLSAIALDLAREKLAAFSCPKEFIQSDYLSYVRERSEAADFVFIGLSLHHLRLPEKEEFFRDVEKFLPDDGRLVFFEPVSRPGEDRGQTLDRWWDDVVRNWSEMTPDELDKCHEHVFSSDYPESVEVYTRAAKEGGFSRVDVLFQDPDDLYAVVECRK